MVIKLTCPLGLLPLDAIYTTLTRCQALGARFPETSSNGSLLAAPGMEAQGAYSQRHYPATQQRLNVLLKIPLVLTRYVSQEPNFSSNCYSLVCPHTSWDANCPSRHFASVGSVDTESPQRYPYYSGKSTSPAIACTGGQTPAYFWPPLLSIFPGS